MHIPILNNDQTNTRQALIPFNNRILSDLMIRSRTGITIYLIVWSLIIFSTGLYRIKPIFSWSVLTLFFLISLVRIKQQIDYRKSSPLRHRFHFRLLVFNVLAPASICVFRPIRPPVPDDSVHPFRVIPSTCSRAFRPGGRS